MTGFTRQQQARMYYSRKRRKTLRTVPRLSQVACPPANSGPTTGYVPESALFSPISFLITADLSVLGTLMSWGSYITVVNDGLNISVTFPDGTFVIPHSGQGIWRMMLSIRPADGAVQMWNQFGSILRAENLTLADANAWSAPGESLTVGPLIAPLGLYTLQLPRHFQASGVVSELEIDDKEDDLLFNATLVFFNEGFPSPILEGDC